MEAYGRFFTSWVFSDEGFGWGLLSSDFLIEVGMGPFASQWFVFDILFGASSLIHLAWHFHRWIDGIWVDLHLEKLPSSTSPQTVYSPVVTPRTFQFHTPTIPNYTWKSFLSFLTYSIIAVRANYSNRQHSSAGSRHHSSSMVPVWITSQPEQPISSDAQKKLTCCLFVIWEVLFSLTSVPMSFILARASSLRLPCSTPELTRGMGISLMGQTKTDTGKEERERERIHTWSYRKITKYITKNTG